ncbi:MAG: autotransporter-associated beta strand repeat-containing protein [Planctomycetia bacterium]|nr:autotransporter-associated beta strand repeat-containing protein [Planctomycetia bacterium]
MRIPILGTSGTYSGAILNSGSLSYGGAANQTFSGPITGAGLLAKTGTSTLTLSSANNTFTGNISIAQGTVQIGGAGQLGSGTYAGAISVASGTAYFNYASSADQTLTGPITGALGSLIQTGPGTLTLTGTNTYTGTTTINSGTLRIGGSGQLGGGTYAAAIINNGNLFYASSANQTLNGAVSGTGSLTKIGSSTLTLSASNTYTGVTLLSGGILNLTGTNSLPGGIGVTGGISGLTFNGGVLGLGIGDFTRSVAASGVGTGVNFAGAGGWAAFTANRLVNLGGNATPTSITWATADTGFNGQTLVLGDATATAMVTLQNPIDLGNAVRTVLVNDGAAAIDATMSGLLSGAGGSLTKTGAGTLLLTGTNTYSGDTNINGGTLSLGNTSALGSGSGLLVVNASTLDLGSLTIVRTGSISLGGGTIQNGTLTNNTFAFDFTSGTVSASLAGAAGLLKSTAGTLTLSGSNTYSGGTTLGAGVLSLSSPNALGTAGTIGFGGGTLQFGLNSGATDYSSRFISAASQAYNLDAVSNVNMTLASGFGGSGSTLTKSGLGTITLSGTNSFSGGMNLNGGVLTVANSSALGDTGSIRFGGGTLQFASSGTVGYASRFIAADGQAYSLSAASGVTATIASPLTNSTGGLTVSGVGSVVLSGSNTYSGGTRILGGSLQFANTSACWWLGRLFGG